MNTTKHLTLNTVMALFVILKCCLADNHIIQSPRVNK